MNIFCLRSVLTSVSISVLIIVLIVGYMRLDVISLEKEKKILEERVAQYDLESKRLLEEYQNNMQKFATQGVKIQTIYRDRVQYIKEKVDENTSCEDIINRFNDYQF